MATLRCLLLVKLSFNEPGYDGGDCCECTCVTTEYYICGRNGGYSCIDPSAYCVDDDDVTIYPDDEYYSGPKSFTSFGCAHDVMSDGDCDEINNNELCGALKSACATAFLFSLTNVSKRVSLFDCGRLMYKERNDIRASIVAVRSTSRCPPTPSLKYHSVQQIARLILLASARCTSPRPSGHSALTATV